MKTLDPVKADKKSAKFKVCIKLPEPWKIQAIAEYKARKKIATEANNAAKITTVSTAPAVNSSSSSSSSSKKGNDIAKGETPKEPTVPRPTLIERSVKELEYWNTRSIVAKERIGSLHSVKNSLLWLLKKAALHERTLINDYPPNPSG